MHSAIYSGAMTHRRDMAPSHRFHYRMRLFWLDLDELSTLFAATPGWSLKPNLLGWFRRHDYLRPDTAALKVAVADEIFQQLGQRLNGPVRMLTAPRVFGVGFNPLTLYYCYQADGETLDFVLAEVRNTPWLERHCYALDVRANHESDVRHPPDHDKVFHVSPFLPLGLRYHWQLNAPDQSLKVQIRNDRDGVTVFRATLALDRIAELTPATLQRELWQHWPQGLKTLAGIYWQAVKLLAKRAKFYGHPGTVDGSSTVTIAPGSTSSANHPVNTDSPTHFSPESVK